VLNPTDDLRIREITALSPPARVIDELPRDDLVAATVTEARQRLHDILQGEDDRVIVVVGPCSIHDAAAALDYAGLLARERHRLADDLEIVMRVYFEKPRTTVGWKGLINDPFLDGSFAIEQGLRIARELLLKINEIGLPAGCEFLDTTIPQYIADLVSWGAIGARTTESQIHRQLASGLSCPVGFKNGTNGDVRIARDAIVAARQPHHFLAVTKQGQAAVAATLGNEDCHLILRGGGRPNYDSDSVDAACEEFVRAGLVPKVMIDASHANSGKNPDNQPAVIAAVAEQIAAGENRIIGAMLESNLVGGRQEIGDGDRLTYGQSVTDGCVDWPTTVAALNRLAESVRRRRRGVARLSRADEARIEA
jgi:3-deoxy-7-phosphoheptulonate synthase